MCRPELRGGHDGVAFSQRQQVLITGDEIVRARCLDCRQQSAKHRLIIDITQVWFHTRQRLNDFSLYGKRIHQIVDFRCCQTMAVRQSRQHALQLVQDVSGKQHIHRTVAPSRQYLARYTGGISDAREQHIRIEYHPQGSQGNSAFLDRRTRLRPFNRNGGIDFSQPFRLGHFGKASLDALA